MKKGVFLGAAVVVAFAMPSVGCKAGAERRFRFYDNADSYTVGAFTCDGGAVKRIEIDWLGGLVEIERSPTDELSVFEEENELSEDKRLHTCLSEGVLRVKYCRSGCRGKIDEMQKYLQVDIPQGLDVEINGVSANVYLGMLETNTLSIETDTGSIEGERIVCRQADIDTNSGYIGIGSLTADSVEIESNTGAIHVGLPACQDTEIETVSGDVTLYLQGGVCALIAFESKVGQFFTKLPYERKGAAYFFAGGGGQNAPNKVSIETESGNLRIE